MVYTEHLPMMLMSADDFISVGKILPQHEALEHFQLLVPASSIKDRKKHLFVLISHRWLRAHKDPKKAHPDNKKKEKFKEIVVGLQILKRKVPADVKIMVWMDFYGINQKDNHRKVLGIKSLPAYIEQSDMLLCPICSNSNFSKGKKKHLDAVKYKPGHNGMAMVELLSADKKLLGLYHAEEMYTRLWIRLEQTLAAHIPLPENGYGWFETKNCHRTDRPILFITPDMEKDSSLITMPSMTLGAYLLIDPLSKKRPSECFDESDRERVADILKELKISMAKLVKLANSKQKIIKEGNGAYAWADGMKYDGDWKDYMAHGKGTFYFSNGDKYEGAWHSAMFHGKGKMYYSDGRIYNGGWKENKKHGENCEFHFADGDKFVGDFKEGKPLETPKYRGEVEFEDQNVFRRFQDTMLSNLDESELTP